METHLQNIIQDILTDIVEKANQNESMFVKEVINEIAERLQPYIAEVHASDS
ncbi:hypothetical protein [Ammoniphilus oxalaticus]|uniref:hypothetical protein n=1 Tax=Ammoniphilus oxalaticus TaxID=66863 RepID=UPI001472D79D|nr:hypothetical protein [Ammoniphilus oxalaticus]